MAELVFKSNYSDSKLGLHLKLNWDLGIMDKLVQKSRENLVVRKKDGLREVIVRDLLLETYAVD